MTRVTYIKQAKIIKKETGEAFYYVYLLVGDEAIKCFVTEEVFKQIASLKPTYKKEYNAKFEIEARFEKLNAKLVGLEENK